jgi:hypothetical protein
MSIGATGQTELNTNQKKMDVQKMNTFTGKRSIPRDTIGILIVVSLVAISTIVFFVFPNKLYYLLLIFSVGFFTFGVKGILPIIKSKNWKQVSATVVSIDEAHEEVAYSEYQKIKYFFPLIEYTYEFDGEKYTSNNVSFDIQNIWIPEVDSFGNKTNDDQKSWSAWAVGSKIDVYVDPKRPSNSIVYKGLSKKRKSHIIALLLVGTILLSLWLFFIKNI